MKMKWQLKKLSTNQSLSEPGPLPVNWGPIFGLHGFSEKLGNLSWLGSDYEDKGWIALSRDEELKLLIDRAKKLIEEGKEILKSQSITFAEKEIVLQKIKDIEKETLKIDFLENPNLPSSFLS